MGFRKSAPLPANPRMKNLLERAFLGCVAKDYGAKDVSIQAAGVRKNFVTEFANQFLPRFGEIGNFARRQVGIEKLRARQGCAQTITKRALAGSDSAGNSDGRH